MNKSKYLAMACGLSLLLGSSCKKEKLMTYFADDNIYFEYLVGVDPANNNLGQYTDSLDLTFSFDGASVQDTVVGIPVGITGLAKDIDRNFKLVVDPASTANASTHYTLPANFVIPAGKLKDTVWIKFNRTADLKTKQVELLLQLQENDQFKTQIEFRPRQGNSQTNISYQDTIKTISFKVNLNDMLSAGPYWNNDYVWYFGTFSEKKVRLMNQIVGMPLSLWSKPISTSKERGDVIYFGGFTARYLSDQAAAGNTIFDENGLPMKMGSNFQ